MSIINSIRKTIRYGKKNGFQAAAYAAVERLQQRKKQAYDYQNPSDLELQRQRDYQFDNPVVISVIVPAYETKPIFMRELIDSLQNQTYPYFELIIADASKSDIVKQTVLEYTDERIKYHVLKQNDGIAENTNQAMQYATGEYSGLLDHDDLLTPDALFEMAYQIEKEKQRGNILAFLYSNEDKCNMDQTEYFDPHFKLDFNKELLLTNNYICHFLVTQTERLQRIGFRKTFDGAQDFDLVLRLMQNVMEEYGEDNLETRISHIDKILYHWRCHTGSTADNPESKMYAYEAGKKALIEYYQENHQKVQVRMSMHLGFYQTEYLPIDSYFNQKEEVGVVGGLLISHGKITGGAYRNGKMLFCNVNEHFSSYMNRAHLTQNVESVDIRCMKVSPKWIPLYEEIIGVPYAATYPEYSNSQLEQEGTLPVLTIKTKNYFDQLSEEEISKRSKLFCEKVKESGNDIVLNPLHRVKI